jgi:hypothetical protein
MGFSPDPARPATMDLDGADQSIRIQTLELDDGADLRVGVKLRQKLKAVPTGQTVAPGRGQENRRAPASCQLSRRSTAPREARAP